MEHLSVSSNGSNPLQQTETIDLKKYKEFFQYPQTDRTPCNINAQFGKSVVRRLSVSSNGSNPLQRFANASPTGLKQNFQYPQTDRTPCNQGETPGHE